MPPFPCKCSHLTWLTWLLAAPGNICYFLKKVNASSSSTFDLQHATPITLAAVTALAAVGGSCAAGPRGGAGGR